MEKLKDVTVYSFVEDKNLSSKYSKDELNNSPIWKQAIHEDELNDIQIKDKPLFQYKMKFDGLKPVQVSKIKKITNR